MLKFQVQKRKGWFWVAKAAIPLIKAFLENYKEGTWFNVVLSVAVGQKTLPQLGYHYGVIVPVVNKALIELGHTMNVMGVEVPIDEDQTDNLLKYFCARLDERGNLNVHDTKRYPDREIMNKRDMSKTQARQFISNEIDWSKAVLNCEIPEPEKC